MHENFHRSLNYVALGGMDMDGNAANMTQIFNETGAYTGPALPFAVLDHCVVKLNKTHILLAGGNTGTMEINRAITMNIYSGYYQEISPMVFS